MFETILITAVAVIGWLTAATLFFALREANKECRGTNDRWNQETGNSEAGAARAARMVSNLTDMLGMPVTFVSGNDLEVGHAGLKVTMDEADVVIEELESFKASIGDALDRFDSSIEVTERWLETAKSSGLSEAVKIARACRNEFAVQQQELRTDDYSRAGGLLTRIGRANSALTRSYQETQVAKSGLARRADVFQKEYKAACAKLELVRTSSNQVDFRDVCMNSLCRLDQVKAAQPSDDADLDAQVAYWEQLEAGLKEFSEKVKFFTAGAKEAAAAKPAPVQADEHDDTDDEEDTVMSDAGVDTRAPSTASTPVVKKSS